MLTPPWSIALLGFLSCYKAMCRNEHHEKQGDQCRKVLCRITGEPRTRGSKPRVLTTTLQSSFFVVFVLWESKCGEGSQQKDRSLHYRAACVLCGVCPVGKQMRGRFAKKDRSLENAPSRISPPRNARSALFERKFRLLGMYLLYTT